MRNREEQRQNYFSEALRIFADAVYFADETLIVYSYLVSDIFKWDKIGCINENSILLSRLITLIGQLPEKEQEILKFRYGLEGHKKLTWDEICEKYGKTMNYIKLIIQNTLFKLLNRRDFFDINTLKYNRLNKILLIENMGFSTRTFNALKRASINNFHELERLTETDMLSIRALGKKGVEEIQAKLIEFKN